MACAKSSGSYWARNDSDTGRSAITLERVAGPNRRMCLCVLAWSPLIRTWQQLGLTRDTWTQLNSTRLLCWCEILVDTAEDLRLH
jgi:hypothetical protein